MIARYARFDQGGYNVRVRLPLANFARALPLLFAASLLLPRASRAQSQTPIDAVGTVGLHSSDVPETELTDLASSLDRAIAVNAAASRGRSATLSALGTDPEVAARRADARRSLEAGTSYMKAFQLDAAQSELDKAAAFWVVAHGRALDAGDVARLYLTRAKLAQIRHQPQAMKEEFEHALPVLATKELDPLQFSPEAIQIFKRALAAASSTPPQPASGASLGDIARRAAIRWILAGDVRRRGGGYAITLSVADVTGAGKSENVELPAGADADTTLDAAVAKLLAAAGVPLSVGRGTPAPFPTPTAPVSIASTTNASTEGGAHPVPTSALPPNVGPNAAAANTHPPRPPKGPKKIYQQWYFWAGVSAVAAGAVIASTSGNSGGKSSSGGQGITLVITQ